jgi:prolyl-tRNA synthetase
MRLSQLFTKTHKEAPHDEDSKSAQLLVRAGFIHKEMAGVYSFLPLGLRVLRNIEEIVRQEMDALGAQELQMTTLQNKQLWEKTGRWSDKEVDVWFKSELKNGTQVGLAPTHEEPMTTIVAEYANSYKDLPIYTYQFQWKMRNELRAKSGILRCREFRMKDLYSFSATQQQHDEFYALIRTAYDKVYDRLGIAQDTYYTYASGGMFSKFSHEFQTVLEVGEDVIYVDDDKKIAINEEVIDDPEVLKELGVQKDNLRKVNASEVGNIFPLGTKKFSEPLGANFADEEGKQHPMIMGCYGIGISRLVGVLAEYFADDNGLVWPASIAPAKVHIVRIGVDEEAIKAADTLYADLQAKGISVLYDDRDTGAGSKFADADLMGVPTRLTISPKTLVNDSVEYKERTESESNLIPLGEILSKLSLL